MAINIPHNTVADHIVFDRIVDADRTINLARTAAEKAEAAGKHDVADKLRAKADALEKILLATQHPEYEDEDTGEDIDPTTSEENTESQGQGSTDSSQESSPEENKTTEEPSTSSSSSTENTDNKSDDESDGKTPEDIKKMNTGDSGAGDHSDDTQKIGPAGGSNAAEGDGDGDGGSGGDSKQSQGQSKNSNNKNKSKELDPFKRGGSGAGSQHQPTPEEIMAAVIKRLSSLSGNAKVGADRALKQLFGELGGIGEIDD